MKKLLIITLCSLLTIVSCDNGVSEQEVGGMLTLNISNGSRLIKTNKDLNIATYSILIKKVGSTEAVVDRQYPEGRVPSFGPFDFGMYSVDVKALNAAGEVVLDTKTPVEVEVVSGNTANANVTISPKDGTGSLEIDVLWTAADLSREGTVSATLTPYGAQPKDLTVVSTSVTNAGERRVSVDQADITTGYQLLTVELKDNGEIARGTVELVRIADMAKSGKKTYDFRSTNGGSGVNTQKGHINIVLNPEMKNPLNIKNDKVIQTAEAGQEITLSAQIVLDDEINANDNVFYTWYDGSTGIIGTKAAKASEKLVATYTVPDKQVTDISLIVFTEDGSRAGDCRMEGVDITKATGGNTGV